MQSVYWGKKWNDEEETGSLGVPGWFSQLSLWLLVSAQVMISQFVSSSPASGPVMSPQSLLGILSLSLSLCPLPRSLCLCHSQNKEVNLKK